jgi:hypothetical protein
VSGHAARAAWRSPVCSLHEAADTVRLAPNQ